MKVLLVHNNLETINKINYFFTKINYQLNIVYENIISVIDENYYDIYIIDVNNVYNNNKSIIKYIRDDNPTSVIFVIEEYFSLKNLTDAFSKGCDDYIKYPFSIQELELRLHKYISSINNQKNIQIDKNIFYNLITGKLIKNNEIINLRKKEKRLLNILLQNINTVVDNNEIYNYVWEGEIKSIYPLRQLVSNLRKLINIDKNHIISYTGIGYKFIK